MEKSQSSRGTTDLRQIILARKQLEAAIIARAWGDDAFRERLMNEPWEALKEMGMDVPEDMSIAITQEKEKTFHLVIPPKPDIDSDSS